MPDEAMWEGFFDPPTVLQLLGLTADARDAADLGCGYGTFTIPAARIVRGRVHAFDIEPEMIASTLSRARENGLRNIEARLRDFAADGTGLPDASVDYVMLFNILHAEQPGPLLREARRILRPGGKAAIMHWNYDPATPRGPPMEIRPRPADCLRWLMESGMTPAHTPVELPPYHYGIVGAKGA